MFTYQVIQGASPKRSESVFDVPASKLWMEATMATYIILSAQVLMQVAFVLFYQCNVSIQTKPASSEFLLIHGHIVTLPSETGFMMRLYPESALTQLEFDKIKELLAVLCNTDYSKNKASQLRIHTHKIS